MKLYPSVPNARARTLARDAVAILLVALFAWLGVRVHGTVDELAALGRGVETAGNSVRAGFGAASRAVEDAPLVGGPLSERLRQAGRATGGRAARQGREGQRTVHALANLLGWLVFLLPTAVLLVVILPRRVRQVRELTAGAAVLRDPADPERRRLLARRAAYGLPYEALVRHTRDPFDDLRRERYDPLVAAALEDAGLTEARN